MLRHVSEVQRPAVLLFFAFSEDSLVSLFHVSDLFENDSRKKVVNVSKISSTSLKAFMMSFTLKRT